MQIDDIQAFLWMARLGSLSRAAREHGIAKATLSLRLARLEDTVQSPLLQRGAGMALTDAGRAFLPHAEAVEAAHRRALDAVTGLSAEVGGQLRVGVTEQLATNLLAPLALQFTAENPRITLDLQVMMVERLLRRDADLDCMVCGALPALEEGATLVAQGFHRYRRRLYAAPAYLERRGAPGHPDELGGHDLVGSRWMGGQPGWHLTDGRQELAVEPRGPFSTNDEWVAKVCVLQNRGISLFPDFFAQEHLETGELVPVLPEWSTAASSVTVLHHPHRFQNAHIRAFIDFLTREFRGFYRYPYRPADLMLPKGW
jgi:DNA-binding transcriptional LysR family regulator